MSHQESPGFVKAYDLLKWLLPSTAKSPKQQRFVLARRIEDTAFAFHRALLRAAAQPRAGLDEADRELAALRIYLRLACELKFYSVGQYEHAARLVDELGRLVGGWKRRLDGVATTTAPRGRAVGRAHVLRGGSWNNNPGSAARVSLPLGRDAALPRRPATPGLDSRPAPG